MSGTLGPADTLLAAMLAGYLHSLGRSEPSRVLPHDRRLILQSADLLARLAGIGELTEDPGPDPDPAEV